MSALAAGLALAKDWLRMGPRFTAGGIAASAGRVGTRKVPVGGGDRIVIRDGTSDFAVCRQIFRDRQYAIPALAQAQRVRGYYDALVAADSIPVIVDAGANIGAAALWLKRLYPGAAVVAIEPDPGNAALARRNLAGLSGVSAIEAAIGGSAGFVAVEPADEPWAVRTARADAGSPVITIADAVATVPNGRLFCVKIDIEGFEDDLFAANTGWLDEAALVYIEPHDWMLPDRATSRGFQAELGKRDFDLLISGENLVYVRRAPL